MKHVLIQCILLLLIVPNVFCEVQLDADGNGGTDIGKGGTNAITIEAARTNLDMYSTSEVDALIPTEASLGVDDLKTLSGVAGGSVNLGTFTGTTIADNQTNKQAMQALETAVEGAAGGHDAVTLGTTNGLSLSVQELSLDATTLMQALDDLTWVFANPITVPGIISSAADGAHYSDVINTVTLTSTATLGRFAFLTDRFWIANGTNWTTRYFFDSSMTIPEANIHGDIARDSELVTVISGTSAMGTSAIASGACATTVTTTATGVATTDVIGGNFNASPLAVTGYAASSDGGLFVYAWPTSNNVNFSVCNNTSGSITPGAVTLNWQIIK